jgi:hypothetical protein
MVEYSSQAQIILSLTVCGYTQMDCRVARNQKLKNSMGYLLYPVGFFIAFSGTIFNDYYDLYGKFSAGIIVGVFSSIPFVLLGLFIKSSTNSTLKILLGTFLGVVPSIYIGFKMHYTTSGEPGLAISFFPPVALVILCLGYYLGIITGSLIERIHNKFFQ